MANVSETRPVKYPSSSAVSTLSIVAAGLSAAAIAAQAAVVIAQQMGKSKAERAGIEGAIRLTIAATLARAVPSILSEVRTISRELQKRST
jgi:hypothetical protein